MKFEVPQRWQFASVRAPLSLFAPVSSTVSCVPPLTRNLSLEDPSPTRGWTGLSEATATRFPVLRTTKCDAFSEARRTKNRLLRYGRDTRCSKRPPMVRDAFSEAFGVKNRLLRYGRDIRCKKQAPMVRDAFSEAFGVKNRLLRYGTDIRYRKRPPMVRDASPKARRTADSTDCGQPPMVRDAFSGAPVHENPLLLHRTHLQCAKRPPRGGEQT